MSNSRSHWLMKAEPETRLERGIDVKFSIDDLKSMQTSPWDGVRNHEAKNIMKSKMKLGDAVLFYHSNCKVPGVYGVAKVVKEGYPDHTAWDPDHPYFDKKSKEVNPTWFMVDVGYEEHLSHPVTLSLFKALAGMASLPDCVDYIGDKGLKAISEMPLVNRGRLSVQPVSPEAFEAVLLLGSKGGWETLEPKKTKSSLKRSAASTAEDHDSDANGDAATPNSEAGASKDTSNGGDKPRRNGKAKKRVRISLLEREADEDAITGSSLGEDKPQDVVDGPDIKASANSDMKDTSQRDPKPSDASMTTRRRNPGRSTKKTQ